MKRSFIRVRHDERSAFNDQNTISTIRGRYVNEIPKKIIPHDNKFELAAGREKLREQLNSGSTVMGKEESGMAGNLFIISYPDKLPDPHDERINIGNEEYVRLFLELDDPYTAEPSDDLARETYLLQVLRSFWLSRDTSGLSPHEKLAYYEEFLQPQGIDSSELNALIIEWESGTSFRSMGTGRDIKLEDTARSSTLTQWQGPNRDRSVPSGKGYEHEIDGVFENLLERIILMNSMIVDLMNLESSSDGNLEPEETKKEVKEIELSFREELEDITTIEKTIYLEVELIPTEFIEKQSSEDILPSMDAITLGIEQKEETITIEEMMAAIRKDYGMTIDAKEVILNNDTLRQKLVIPPKLDRKPITFEKQKKARKSKRRVNKLNSRRRV